MSVKVPTVEEWRKLYELAVQLQKLAPWDWLSEIDLFGVKSPETGEIGFVSVSGMDDRDPGLRCFRGSEGLHQFLDFLEHIHEASPTDLMQLAHIQLAFTQRRNLFEAERQMVQQLKFKVPRQSLYPAFRTYAPGMLPWGITQEEGRMLIYVLEQTLDVARRSKKNEDLLTPDNDASGFLVRTPINENGILRWEDQFVEVDSPDKIFVPPAIDDRSLLVLHQLPKLPQTLEMDVFMTPVPAIPDEDPNGRPYFPFLLMALDAKNGMIYLNENLRPTPSLDAMWRTVPQILINLFAKIGFIPAEVRTASDEVCEMLKTVSYRLKFTVRQTDSLPAFNAAALQYMNSMVQDFISTHPDFEELEDE